MKCEKCGQNDATIHLVRIENGVTNETHMCAGCAAQNGMLTGSVSLKDMLTSFMTVQPAEPPKACSQCGYTIADIKKTGFVGCENCYVDLRQELLPMIQAIHGSIVHVGKTPQQSGYAAADTELDALQVKLHSAVQEERYEEAAQLRDRISNLQQSKGGM